MSVFLFYFGWPDGAVWSNLMASVICAVVVWWRLRARMIAHHAEQLAQAARHHREQLAAAAQVSGGAGTDPASQGLPADQRVVPPPAATTSSVAVPQKLLDDIRKTRGKRPS